MMVNEFKDRVYNCAGDAMSGYHCMYESDLAGVGLIRGTAVLEAFGYQTGLEGTWVGIMVGIIAGYRILGYVVLMLKKT